MMDGENIGGRTVYSGRQRIWHGQR